MHIRLSHVNVSLQSENEVVYDGWRTLLDNVPADLLKGEADVELTLHLTLVNTLPHADQAECIYTDAQGIVDVFRLRDGSTLALHFRQGAWIEISPDGSSSAKGVVTPSIFREGHLEDVTFAALASLLRRHGCYLVHAAAVETDSGAILFVGPSHSGKTTTALSLVTANHKHLASDVTALTLDEGRIVAHPTAGTPRVREKSLNLLPKLNQYVVNRTESASQIRLPTERWGSGSEVRAVLFPTVTGGSQSRLESIPDALALARLMEESVDKWDAPVLFAHIDFLTMLARRARLYRLLLGKDMDQLRHLLESTL